MTQGLLIQAHKKRTSSSLFDDDKSFNCFLFLLYLDQSDEPADPNFIAGGVDNVPMPTNSREQLLNVPVYTATDYEHMLKYKNA